MIYGSLQDKYMETKHCDKSLTLPIMVAQWAICIFVVTRGPLGCNRKEA